ncbi:MAG: hypothetical protein K0S35_3981, partial [Geminicoccaceae bacterium]|nr:hypothetical protein [Geminicoccaceae bacterium]
AMTYQVEYTPPLGARSGALLL